MKKIVLSIAIVFCCSTAMAATDDVVDGMGKKAVRGAVNLVTGIVEVPMQVYKGYDKGFSHIENEIGSKTVGIVLGFFRGVGHATGRMSWGALELFGFWAINPDDNNGVGIPLDAEYAWEMGQQHSYFDPSLKEGVKPIGHKLVRGLSNGFLGILELPGQTIKGAREGSIIKGVGQGFWFWLSREVYGLGDIYSSLVPNPVDNPGYAFPQEYPWEALSE